MKEVMAFDGRVVTHSIDYEDIFRDLSIEFENKILPSNLRQYRILAYTTDIRLEIELFGQYSQRFSEDVEFVLSSAITCMGKVREISVEDFLSRVTKWNVSGNVTTVEVITWN